MYLICRHIRGVILASIYLLAVTTTTLAQAISGTPNSQTDEASKAETASLQKKAHEAQVKIRENEADRDQLMRAVKINEVPIAKEVLLRIGFTAKDLENAKIILRTGGGKGGDDQLTISATCCDPKEITIQRTVEHFTK